MISEISAPRLKGYRFSRSSISYAVRAHRRFALSPRDVDDLLAERGVIVSYETIRSWVVKFGRQLQRFLSIHDETAHLFRTCRHKMTASAYDQKRATAFDQWNDCASCMAA